MLAALRAGQAESCYYDAHRWLAFLPRDCLLATVKALSAFAQALQLKPCQQKWGCSSCEYHKLKAVMDKITEHLGPFLEDVPDDDAARAKVINPKGLLVLVEAGWYTPDTVKHLQEAVEDEMYYHRMKAHQPQDDPINLRFTSEDDSAEAVQTLQGIFDKSPLALDLQGEIWYTQPVGSSQQVPGLDLAMQTFAADRLSKWRTKVKAEVQGSYRQAFQDEMPPQMWAALAEP